MDITVTPFDASDEKTAHEALAVMTESRRARHPRLPAGVPVNFLGGLTHPWPGNRDGARRRARRRRRRSATSRSASRSSTTWRTPTSSSTSRPVTAARASAGPSTAAAEGCRPGQRPQAAARDGHRVAARRAGPRRRGRPRSPPRSASSRRWPRCAAGSTSATLDQAALDRDAEPRAGRRPRATAWCGGTTRRPTRSSTTSPTSTAGCSRTRRWVTSSGSRRRSTPTGSGAARRPRGARPPAVQHRGQARRLRPAGRLDHARVRRDRALARVPEHHDRRAPPPRPPPRRDREGREPALGARRRAADCASWTPGTPRSTTT